MRTERRVAGTVWASSPCAGRIGNGRDPNADGSGDRNGRQSVSLFISRGRSIFTHKASSPRRGRRARRAARSGVRWRSVSVTGVPPRRGASGGGGRPRTAGTRRGDRESEPAGAAGRGVAPLPALVNDGPASPMQPEQPPWPQFAELLALRDAWAYPGGVRGGRITDRHAKTRPMNRCFSIKCPRRSACSHQFTYPRTGLPRDPYALPLLSSRHLARRARRGHGNPRSSTPGGARLRGERHRRSR